MMTTEQFTIKRDMAIKYLVTYVAEGEDEWLEALGSLSSRVHDKDLLRNIIAATILLPAQDRSVIPEIPYNLLFWIRKYDQFKRKDWQKELQKVFAKDDKITDLRSQLVVLGCIDPIEYAPYPRQALRWLVDRSKKSEDYSKETEKKFRSLVHVYGGVTISNVFKQYDQKLSRLLNWRSHYFFEKTIHSIYDIEQLVRIKKTEIDKTNPTLVKKL